MCGHETAERCAWGRTCGFLAQDQRPQASWKAHRRYSAHGNRRHHSRPSSLQAGQRPTKNLASDPATPQSCGLRPVTEKSEIETEIKVNLSDKTHKVIIRGKAAMKKLQKRTQE